MKNTDKRIKAISYILLYRVKSTTSNYGSLLNFYIKLADPPGFVREIELQKTSTWNNVFE